MYNAIVFMRETMLSGECFGGGSSAPDVRDGLLRPLVARASPSYGRCGMTPAPGVSVETRSSNLAGPTADVWADQVDTFVSQAVPAGGTPSRGFGPR